MLARLTRWIRTATGRNAEVAQARLEERAAIARALRSTALRLRTSAAQHPIVRFQVGLPVAADELEQLAKTLGA